MSDFDLGGFLQIQRTFSIWSFLRYPSNFPLPPHACKSVEVFGTLYGLKESNRLLSDEMHCVMLSAQFRKVGFGCGTYVSASAGGEICIVTVHADTFLRCLMIQFLWVVCLAS